MSKESKKYFYGSLIQSTALFYGNLIQSTALFMIVAALFSAAFNAHDAWRIENIKSYRSTHPCLPVPDRCSRVALAVSGLASAALVAAVRRSVFDNGREGV